MKKTLLSKNALRSLFWCFALLLLLPGKGWGQVNIPIRTDIADFVDWKDVSLAGTTYLQLLTTSSSIISPAMDFKSF